MRIELSVFKYIEHELYNYEETKRALENYKEDIIEGTSKPEVAVTGGRMGDSTGNKAAKLTTSKFVLKCERVIHAIDKSLKILTEEHRELYKLRYRECRSWQEVIAKMHISQRTYYNLRRGLVAMVGQELGLVNLE